MLGLTEISLSCCVMVSDWASAWPIILLNVLSDVCTDT